MHIQTKCLYDSRTVVLKYRKIALERSQQNLIFPTVTMRKSPVLQLQEENLEQQAAAWQTGTGNKIYENNLRKERKMSLEKAKAYLREKGMEDRVIRLEDSTATVDDHSAVRLTIPELERIAGAKGWVDVCKE